MRNTKPILLVEDDNVDAMMVKRSLKDLNIPNPMIHLLNGEEALGHLQNDSNERPCVILLDLNMPRMNGIELLQVVKNDDKLRKIPIVVLTTSKAEQDKTETFKLGVAGYMLKGTDYKKFVEIMRVIDLYWTLSELPEDE
ncbi:MAG: response regulator [Phycisphaerae bacterium]|nr:response regulator [Phycisphaerae bacterium]